MSAGYIVLVAVGLVLIVLLGMMIPDIIRYMKISSM
jgi:hypothetical protein